MNKYALRKTPVAAAIGALLGSGSIAAATITVTSSLDAPLGSFPDECTLRSAVTAANLGVPIDSCAAGAASGNEIVFAPDLAESVITLSVGELEVTRALRIVGPVAGDRSGITVDGNNNSRLFSAYGTSPGDFLLGLDSMTLRNGRTTGYLERGGALYLHYASLELTDVDVLNNSTVGMGAFGGAVGVYDGDINMNRTSIAGNFTVGVNSFGGAVGVYRGNVSMTETLITGNSTAGEYGIGGGLGMLLGNLLVTDSAVIDNLTTGESGRAGGIYMVLGDALLERVTIGGNVTTGESAFTGGVQLSSGEFQIHDSAILNNSATGDGASTGGLGISRAYAAIIARTTISGNQTSGGIPPYFGVAAPGGGLTIDDASFVALIESTVEGNSTSGEHAHGGGVMIRSGSELELINSTVSGNVASGVSAKGGGLYIEASSAAHLLHSTIAFNSATTGADGIHKYDDDQAYLGVVALRNSMIVQGLAGETACNHAPAAIASSLDTDGSCVLSATPLAAIALQPLADNGGPGLTHALNPGSVAINAAGDCNVDHGVVIDQRGEPRPGIGSGVCDIGAFEYQAPDQLFRDRFEN